VCAAAVIFPYDYTNPEINDSKQLTEKKREQLREIILKDAVSWAVTEVSAEEIDRMNILRASIHAMNLAVGQLTPAPELLLIDGNRFTDRWGIPYRCVVKGDATYLSIAAASILAKTHRDALMRRLSDEFPAYDWARNKGYPTPTHIAAVNRYGLTPWHRKSFHLKNQLSLDL
jgi:ribonuclease HII